MGDRILAGGVEEIGSFQPIQLYAGEKQVVTTQGTLKAGQKVGRLNARNETFKFGIVQQDADAGLIAYAGGAAKPYGILPHALDTTATGYGAAVDTPVIVEAIINFEALDTAMTYAECQVAFAGSGITIQKLY